MAQLKLMVAGDPETVALFSLLGASGYVCESPEELKGLLDYLEAHEKEIGGLLLGAQLYDKESRYLARIRKLGIPMIFLPSQDAGADAGRLALEALTEKAMGMKLGF